MRRYYIAQEFFEELLSICGIVLHRLAPSLVCRGVFSVRVNSNALAPATASLSVPSVQGTIDSKRASVLMMSGEWGLLLRFS